MNRLISSVVLGFVIGFLAIAVPCFGIGQMATSSEKGMLFPEFDVRKGTNDWVELVLKQKALCSRLPEKASKDEQSLIISPGILPIEELREIFLEKWLPKDISVFEKKHRWMHRLSGLKLEEHGGADALVARFKAETVTVQVVYMVNSIIFFAKNQTPFLPSDRFATEEDIKTLLAMFLTEDLCAKIPANVSKLNMETTDGKIPCKLNMETTDGQKIVILHIIPGITLTPLSDKKRSIVAAEELRTTLIVSGQYLSFSFGKTRQRKWEGAQPQGFSDVPLFVQTSSSSESFFKDEQEIARKALERKTTNSLDAVIVSLHKVLREAPTKPEDIERENGEHPGIDMARRRVVRALYQTVFAALQRIGDFQAEDRATVIDKALDAQSRHPVARIYQSELRRSILRVMKTVSQTSAARIAKRMIESETHAGLLREELGILYDGVPEAEYIEYVHERIKALSTAGAGDRKELLEVCVQCLPRSDEKKCLKEEKGHP